MQGMTDHEKELAAGGGLHASLVQQLTAAARMLGSKPELPLDKHGHATISYFAESPREVDAIAAALCLTAAWNDEHSHYGASYSFGPNVAYQVTYILPAVKKVHAAHMNSEAYAAERLAAIHDAVRSAA